MNEYENTDGVVCVVITNADGSIISMTKEAYLKSLEETTE